MCGIFGFIGNGNGQLNLKRLERMARNTEQRGPHAFGFAWIDQAGRLKHFKQSGRITSHLGLLGMARDARAIIGHCRFATHGDYHNNLNNHPHACDSGFLVHNGVVSGHEQLADQFGLALTTECDSEVICRMIEHFEGTLLARAQETMQYLHRPVAIAAIWTRPGRVLLARNGNPISQSTQHEGTYFASLPDELPGRAVHFPDRKIRLLNVA